MGCAAAPAILSRTTVLRPVSQPRLLATRTAVNLFFVASTPAGAPVACDGLHSGPGDSEPNTVVRRLAALRAASGAYAPSLQVLRNPL